MDRKAKGWRSENKARLILDSMGYSLVVRSGASLGLFDLVALGIDRDNVLLLQIRTNRKPGAKEMDILKAFQCPSFCQKQLWIFKDYSKKPEIIAL